MVRGRGGGGGRGEGGGGETGGLTVGTISKALLWVVYVWVVLNLVLLFLAFVLRLFGANPEAGFTQWVYRSVTRSMAPFRGIFEPIALSDQSVLDTSLLFAMIVYGLAACSCELASTGRANWSPASPTPRAGGLG